MRNLKAPRPIKFFCASFLLITFLLVSCNNETEPTNVTLEDAELSSFSFLASNNPSLDSDIVLSISNNEITGRVPYNGDITNLIATFTYTGSQVIVDGFNQTSDTSYNNFSNVVTYSVLNGDGEQEDYDVRVKYFTGLPIFYIDTNGIPIDTKEEYIEGGNASFFGGLDYNDGLISDMKIRGRGHSTWFLHPKKPYQLKYSEKNEVLGMPEDKKWIFLAEYSDKTLMRNKIAFEMGY
ncbi:MAG: CotH kinase family protein, partial [Bacteroidia bacterium]|nr:CotH kinase family protein [Bacteroidia bacterium]